MGWPMFNNIEKGSRMIKEGMRVLGIFVFVLGIVGCTYDKKEKAPEATPPPAATEKTEAPAAEEPVAAEGEAAAEAEAPAEGGAAGEEHAAE